MNLTCGNPVTTKNTPSGSPTVSLPSGIDFHEIFDLLTVGILLMDSALRVITINRYLEAVTGYRRQDVEGVRGEHLLRSNLGDLTGPAGKVLAAREPLTLEGDIINQSRKKVPVSFTIFPLRLTSGETAGVGLLIEDLSLVKEYEGRGHSFDGKGRVIGHCQKMQDVFELLPIAARTDTSVLVTGETGTGKDLIAEAIHKASSRSRFPFIKVNCGALPESLLESELFGYVRGAFTGADKDKPGLFRLAHGGTIFLTEIGDLPLSLQVKFLTVLDDKEFFPVGASQKVKVNVRVITATHRDLTELVRLGEFREDLYYRLYVLRLHLPPLREREDDYRLLLDHFLRGYADNLGKKIEGFSNDCLEMLACYRFPGNIRELRNIVEYAADICPGGEILLKHLPQNMLASATSSPPDKRGEPPIDHGLRTSAPAIPRVALPMNLKEMERKIIMDSLTETTGNRSKAAEVLGWSRSKLWRKIKEHHLNE
jgi:transcriptional regulator with PAS, ATPase and Fis domain